VAVVAPTGIAADNIQGVTLDSWLQIPPHAYETKSQQRRPNAQTIATSQARVDVLLNLHNVDVVVLDEVSMISALKW
jgi:hypothetical protein